MEENKAIESLKMIVAYEIKPLLKEYWFDQDDTAEEQIKLLLEKLK